MTWKPTPKPLSPAEIIEHEKKEATPFWQGSAPLFSITKSPEGLKPLSLGNEFAESEWFLFFMNSEDFESERFLRFSREWIKRYQNVTRKVLFIVSEEALLKPEHWEQWFKKNALAPAPVVFDKDGLIVQSWLESADQRFLFLKDQMIPAVRGPSSSASDSAWTQAEVLIQKVIREKDPGLPLLRPLGS